MAPAEVMSDRLCIQSNGARAVELSPYELMACATSMAAGCDGGESTVAYEYARSVGIVSVGLYKFNPVDRGCT
jgi:cathepsin B